MQYKKNIYTPIKSTYKLNFLKYFYVKEMIYFFGQQL